MKIKFDIDPKYQDTEIHICCNRESKETAEIQNLLESIFFEQLNVYKNHETKSVGIHEIVRIYSENKKVYLRSVDDTFEIKDRLYVLEEKLRDRGFVRISNTEIVNISQIDKLDMTYIGTIKMVLKNGDVTFVSRRYVSRMRQALK